MRGTPFPCTTAASCLFIRSRRKRASGRNWRPICALAIAAFLLGSETSHALTFQAAGKAALTFAGALDAGLSFYDHLGGESDDNPLYYDSESGPTITVTATATTFDLVIHQANDITEFVDDHNVTISGDVTGPIFDDDGTLISEKSRLWEVSLTFEASLGLLSTSLDVFGFVKHAHAPHPREGERPHGPPLDFHLTVNNGTSTATAPQKNETHAESAHRHKDRLTRAELSAACCSWVDGSMDHFTLNVSAVHAIPEPSTYALLATGLGVVAFSARRKRAKREMS